MNTTYKLLFVSLLCFQLYAETTNQLSSLNFGVVVNNETHQIYRSAKLGTEGLAELKLHLEASDLPFPKTIIYMNSDGYGKSYSYGELKQAYDSSDSFFGGVISAGRRGTSGAYALEEFMEADSFGYDFHHSFGSESESTYVDGFSPYAPHEDIDGQDLLGDQASKLFSPGRSANGRDGGIDEFNRVMDLVLDPNNQPVLFHCRGGHHRTGMVGLIIRYLQSDQWLEGPLKFARPKNLWDAGKSVEIFSMLNPAEYEYYTHNTTVFRPENLVFAKAYRKSSDFASLQKRYRELLQAE
ncbi:MAG: hypothetical protein HOE90_10250 [Bacteriovoracaceae bacterium]|jgi:hypothetical protein|nr:hypothetical protein [Bacteriovoracaceae bacterium]